MSRAVVGAWRLTLALLHLLIGMLVMQRRFSSLEPAGRHAHIQRWSAQLLRRLGLVLTVQGEARGGATLMVANHVSWLDIAAIHAAVPQARFVSKSDIRHWPCVGRLVAGAGTLFIERDRKRDAMRVVHQMADALRAGDTVAIFPEGTTGAGPSLLPFHANLLQAAIATQTAVQPVVLRFHQPGQAFSPAAEFVGETTLLQSLWRIACAKGLQIELQLLDAERTAHADRRALAAHLRERIDAALTRAAARQRGRA